MKFSVNQHELMNAINITSKAVSSKTNLEILKGILLEAKDGSLSLKSNDLNLAIEMSIPAMVEEAGKIVLDAKFFSEVIRKLPNEVVTFAKETSHVTIQCNRSNFKLMDFASEDFPEIPVVETDIMIPVHINLLRNMIKQTNFAVSTDETRPVLTGSLLEINDKNFTMVAIDGYRLALKKAYVDTLHNATAIIPGRTLGEVLKIIGSGMEHDVVIKITEKYVSFEIDNIRIISKILEGEYIKYEQIIPNEFNTKVILKTNAFINAIDRASLMARESKSSTIKLSFAKGELEITSNSEIGSVKEVIDADIDGKSLEIGFNPRYLLEALKVIENDKIEMHLTTSVSPCIIRPFEDQNYIYFVSPVRMSS